MSSLNRMLLVLTVLISLVFSAVALAQDGDSAESVEGLIKKALDQYSNLQLDPAKESLNEALSYANDIDRPLLAKVYIAYSVLWLGGYVDTAEGKNNFEIALCLDESASVDPMYSSPDIDTVFAEVKQSIASVDCSSVLAGKVQLSADESVVHPSGIERCGDHAGVFEQKRKYEVPIEVTTENSDVSPAKVVVKFAFNGSSDYTKKMMGAVEGGYGYQISCDDDKIRDTNPDTVSYFIEGYDAGGRLVCGNGTSTGPYVVEMSDEAELVIGGSGLAGPLKCEPCPPWDDDCPTNKKPGLGEVCEEIPGCRDELACVENVCAEVVEKPKGFGPTTFYVNVTAGTGFGIMSQDVQYRKFSDPNDSTPPIGLESATSPAKGAAWSGIPLRLTIGFHLNEKLSLEVGGRFDLKIDVDQQAKTCSEVYGDYSTWAALPNSEAITAVCGPANNQTSNVNAAIQNGEFVYSKRTLVAWMINARVRYVLLQKEKLRFALFGGLGYGKIKYRVKSDAEKTGQEVFFPMPAGFDVVLGPSLAIYFNKHLGLIAEVPIDVVMGDGFAFNMDFALGLSVGF